MRQEQQREGSQDVTWSRRQHLHLAQLQYAIVARQVDRQDLARLRARKLDVCRLRSAREM